MPQHIRLSRGMWLSYQILIFDIIGMCVLKFECHILNFSKNANEVILHAFIPYIQVMIKHNVSFQILWLRILYMNYEKWSFSENSISHPPSFALQSN